MTPDIEITADSLNPATTTEVNIQGATIESTLVTGGTGTPGAPGTPGEDGTDGRDIEIQNNGTHIQWRYVGDGVWTDLVLIASLQGANGVDGTDGLDGAEMQLQVVDQVIQYRYGSDPWTTLVDLSPYTTTTELTTALSGYATTSALTSGLATKQDTGDYATNASLTAGLAGKANSSHTHATSDVSGLDTTLADKSDLSHIHDDRYYTETEIDTMIGGLTPAAHTHSYVDVTDFDSGVSSALQTMSIDSLYDVDTSTATDDQVLQYNATTGVWGTTDLPSPDLSGYATDSDLTTGLAAKANTADLATVATSGSYNDLADLPSGGGGQSVFDIIIASDGTGDYTNLVTGLNACPNNARVFIKPGTYTLTSNTTITPTGLKLYGAGQNSTVIALGAYWFLLTGNYIEIRDIKFTTTMGYLYTDSSDYLVVEDCWFDCTPSGANAYAAYLGGTTHLFNRITLKMNNTQTSFKGIVGSINTTVSNSYFEGYIAGVDGASFFVQAAYVVNCKFVASQNGVDGNMVYCGVPARVVNNVFTYGVGYYNGCAIAVQGARSVITGNTIDTFKYAVRSLKRMSIFSENTVIPMNTSGAVMVTIDDENTTVTNNTFGNPNASATNVTGVRAMTNNNAITGNTFRALGVGIDIQSGATNNVVVANTGNFNTDGILDNGTGTVITGNGIA